MSSSLRRPSPATRRFRPTLDVLEDRITPVTASEYAVQLALIVVVEIKDVIVTGTASGFNKVASDISQASGSSSASPPGLGTVLNKFGAIAERIASETLSQPSAGSGGGLFSSAGTGAGTGTFAPP
jgi:hypothetical protein